MSLCIHVHEERNAKRKGDRDDLSCVWLFILCVMKLLHFDLVVSPGVVHIDVFVSFNVCSR